MPTYDYVCQACGHAFEQFQEMSAKKLRKCPKCKKPRLQRLVGRGAGLIFKGSGFYETDYKRSRTDGKAAKPDAPKETTPAAPTTPAASEKPAAATPAKAPKGEKPKKAD